MTQKHCDQTRRTTEIFHRISLGAASICNYEGRDSGVNNSFCLQSVVPNGFNFLNYRHLIQGPPIAKKVVLSGQ